MKKKKAEGLGDTVHNILKATGIDKVAKFVLGEDCGCEERREEWNKRWRYKKLNCLTEEHYKWLTEFFDRSPNRVTASEVKTIFEIHNTVFSNKQEVSSCGSCISSMLSDLNIIYKSYE